jgi:hypothetical protein
MKKTLFFVLAALVVLGCSNPSGDNDTDKTETRTFWRAEKIGEIDEPALTDGYLAHDGSLRVTCWDNPNVVHDWKAAWLRLNKDKYEKDIYIGQSQPPDSDQDPRDEAWDPGHEVKHFIRQGGVISGWPYDSDVIFDFRALTTDRPETIYVWYYNVVKANIYRWTQVTE